MTEIIGRYVDVWGAPVYYESAGAGPVIVGLHTAGRDGRQWHGWMTRLADTYRVVAPDFPGHSKSWPLPGNRVIDDPDRMVEWVWQFCASLGVTDPIIAGCSMGGNWSLGLAARYPGVRAIVAIEGAAHTAVLSEAALGLFTHPEVNFVEFTRGQSVGLIGSRAGAEERAFLTWQVQQSAPACQQADLRAYVRFDIRGQLSGISCPVLLLRGSEDWLVSQEMVEETAEGIKHAELRVIEGGGHYLHAELPGEVCEIVREFIERRLGAGQSRLLSRSAS